MTAKEKSLVVKLYNKLHARARLLDEHARTKIFGDTAADGDKRRAAGLRLALQYMAQDVYDLPGHFDVEREAKAARGEES